RWVSICSLYFSQRQPTGYESIFFRHHIAWQFRGSGKQLSPEASLSLGRQWQQALQYLHTEMGQRGHKPDASTYNALPEDADDPDLEKLKDYLARCLMQDEFQPGDHVLDLHGMSLSSAKKAVRLALDDQTERVLLIVTGQGKHSSEKAVLKEGVASMLKQLHCRVRATEGGFYVSRTPAHAAAITRRNATRCSTA
ncbi:unnamed protein product, partial [Effrenium voratum]